MDLIYALLRAAFGLALVVALTRANGLRSFSKMSGFDFALTLAIGSTLASITMSDTQSAFWAASAALVALYAMQAIVIRAREQWEPLRKKLDNGPLLLVENGRILDHNLVRGNVAHADIMVKLREANALRLNDVHAVVLETTGDVSVLHGEGPVDEALLNGVIR
ncbi:DUF421 domain-containing protein [Palleronia abyssalis]|uniref:YetF C-terminal domain-containing protein n=1 Tax=Palleronia abyssalis TaxID=1501240 RepID=A0A2R8BSU2_9RHOB|nr:YetF domain-containing protein [Palleronia abyssalis]SPJ23257.1 hypothetical protein PAA8504_01065 [Palleronia abyssalis]